MSKINEGNKIIDFNRLDEIKTALHDHLVAMEEEHFSVRKAGRHSEISKDKLLLKRAETANVSNPESSEIDLAVSGFLDHLIVHEGSLF